MKSEGICDFCDKKVSGNAMKRHLLSCSEREKANKECPGQEKIFFIKAGADPFWVYFEADGSSTLKETDSFLRGLWLECCGHLSLFTIFDETYASSPQKEHGDRSMNIQLKNMLFPGLKFSHEYDFGTTTMLGIECVSERLGKAIGEINVLARNNLPDFLCACGKPAKDICSQCEGEDGSLLCAECGKEHECGEDMLLPIVNSPRTGMCGYTG